MLKKTMALVLTLVMTAALAVPMVAFASSDYHSSDVNSADKGVISSGTKGDATIIYNSQTDVPTLNLTITGGGGLVMNPYGIARDTTEFGLDGLVGGSSNSSQIISTQLKIRSTTDVPVKIGATVQAVVGLPSGVEAKNGIQMATSVADKDTTKKVAMFLAAAKDATTAAGTISATTYPSKDDSGDATKPGILLVKTAYDAQKKTGAVTNTSIYTLAAGNSTAQECVFQFFGKMVPEPLNNPWVPDDTITPTVILDFQLQKVAST